MGFMVKTTIFQKRGTSLTHLDFEYSLMDSPSMYILKRPSVVVHTMGILMASRGYTCSHVHVTLMSMGRAATEDNVDVGNLFLPT